MKLNATLEENIFSFDCPSCGTRNSADITAYDPQFLEEIGTYENFTVICTKCRTQIGFNMAIPLFEIAEPPGYFEYASDDDRALRAILRYIMWTRMPELREKDYKTEEELYRKENNLDEEIEQPPAEDPAPEEPPAGEPAPDQEPEQPAAPEPTPEPTPEPEQPPAEEPAPEEPEGGAENE